MAISDAFKNALMNLIFNATAIPNIADNAAAAPLTTYWISLHTADPGGAGNQSTNEVAYTGYARVPVARTPAGWTIVGGVASPAANIDFPPGTPGLPNTTATFLGIGEAQTGAGELLCSGALNPSVICGNAILPRLTTATTVTLS